MEKTDSDRLREQGYHSVDLGGWALRGKDPNSWPAVHDWCRQHVGVGKYTWTGSRFWFENEQHAVSFALRWS